MAAAKLKPGGLCLAYSGHVDLPSCMNAMGEHLAWWWMFSIQFAGADWRIFSRSIHNAWRPVVAFAKPPIAPAPEWLKDSLLGGGREKDLHGWQQAESEASYLIRKLTLPGALVVDPFCGSGTIPAACLANERCWLATEINGTTAAVARKRLCESVVEGEGAKTG